MIWIFALIITLNITVAVTTYLILSKGGIELNPIGAFLINHGWIYAAFFKLVITSIVCYLVYYAYKRDEKAGIRLGLVASGVFLVVCCLNVWQLIGR